MPTFNDKGALLITYYLDNTTTKELCIQSFEFRVRLYYSGQFAGLYQQKVFIYNTVFTFSYFHHDKQPYYYRVTNGAILVIWLITFVN